MTGNVQESTPFEGAARPQAWVMGSLSPWIRRMASGPASRASSPAIATGKPIGAQTAQQASWLSRRADRIQRAAAWNGELSAVSPALVDRFAQRVAKRVQRGVRSHQVDAYAGGDNLDSRLDMPLVSNEGSLAPLSDGNTSDTPFEFGAFSPEHAKPKLQPEAPAAPPISDSLRNRAEQLRRSLATNTPAPAIQPARSTPAIQPSRLPQPASPRAGVMRARPTTRIEELGPGKAPAPAPATPPVPEPPKPSPAQVQRAAQTPSPRPAPANATLPILYTWSATNYGLMAPPAPDGISNPRSLSWNVIGPQVVTVTASNGGNTVTATRLITVTPVDLSSVGIISTTPAALAGTPITFSAFILPINATTPITYAWSATNQSPITQIGGGAISAQQPFTWATPGTQFITVTASNAGNSVNASIAVNILPIAPASVTITPPGSVVSGTPASFTANVSPANVTLPLTYTWSATNQAGVVNSNVNSAGNNINFTWAITGSKTVTVVVSNGFGNVVTGTVGVSVP